MTADSWFVAERTTWWRSSRLWITRLWPSGRATPAGSATSPSFPSASSSIKRGARRRRFLATAPKGQPPWRVKLSRARRAPATTVTTRFRRGRTGSSRWRRTRRWLSGSLRARSRGPTPPGRWGSRRPPPPPGRGTGGSSPPAGPTPPPSPSPFQSRGALIRTRRWPRRRKRMRRSSGRDRDRDRRRMAAMVAAWVQGASR
mmetsp:Transcript_2221/g.5230  ORF Transcript_2221/g.5230 Transcript_2221/m.5230 type:complete len:201 (-) Transcript_2221:201-803(-)